MSVSGSSPSAVRAVLAVQDQKANGTAGGAAVATTWTGRVLNTVVANTIANASLAANQITLPAGTYRIDAASQFFNLAARVRLRLRNTTGGATLLLGACSFSAAGQGLEISLGGQFTLAATSVLELQYWSAAAVATNGLGVESSSTGGENEVFTSVVIEKI